MTTEAFEALPGGVSGEWVGVPGSATKLQERFSKCMHHVWVWQHQPKLIEAWIVERRRLNDKGEPALEPSWFIASVREERPVDTLNPFFDRTLNNPDPFRLYAFSRNALLVKVHNIYKREADEARRAHELAQDRLFTVEQVLEEEEPQP